jgi:hypothetical protein
MVRISISPTAYREGSSDGLGPLSRRAESARRTVFLSLTVCEDAFPCILTIFIVYLAREGLK